LMTFRIFFWSNFFGSPWTVVKVLRPLRSVRNHSQYRSFVEEKPARLRSRQCGGASETELCMAHVRPPGFGRMRRMGPEPASGGKVKRQGTYVECVYGCNSAPVCFLRCLRRLRRRGLRHTIFR
jgi:hypothetical protein